VKIRPRTPRTNGKVERWFGTVSRELLARQYFNSEEDRRAGLDDYARYYNQQRPHSSIGYSAPTPYRLHYFENHH